jgi:Protein implicated in ribosomal biogenesis, Nop56p homolog
MAILVTKWFGVFLVDEKTNRIIDKILMSSDADEVANKLAMVQRGSILSEEKDLAKKLPKIYVSDQRQSDLGKTMMYDSSFIKPDDHGFNSAMMHEIMVKLGKLRTSEPVSRDKNLVQAIRSLDDLVGTANLLSERLHEWYGMHFPELADFAKDQRYASLISKHGDREGIIRELDIELESMGADLSDEDLDSVRSLADTLCGVYRDKERTESYISEIVSEICPNMCALLEGPLSARLISLAGGLQRLSSLPSSTIQLLGAEKAMFRHLRSGKKPPKHGVIYQHPHVHRAPYWQRGKIARALAGKALIAIKIDAYGGEYLGDDLKSEFEARVADIKRKYPDPPKPAAKPNKGKKRRTNKARR